MWKNTWLSPVDIPCGSLCLLGHLSDDVILLYYNHNPWGFAFLRKLKLFLYKRHWDYQISIWKESEKDSGPLTIVKREKYT